ncbi:MAG: type I 3-dehydroquinate dehydratase, partial [bacterium]
MPSIGTLSLGGVPRVALAVAKSEDPALKGVRTRGVDVLEARLDLWRKDSSYVSASLTRLKALGLPILLTCRLRSEGGSWHGTENARIKLLLGHLKYADAVDIELLAADSIREVSREVLRADKTLLISNHSMTATPKDAELEIRFDAAKRLGAHIVKLACLARDGNDMLRLLALVWRRRREGVIGISMGPKGALSRTAAPHFGSLLTYAGQK